MLKQRVLCGLIFLSGVMVIAGIGLAIFILGTTPAGATSPPDVLRLAPANTGFQLLSKPPPFLPPSGGDREGADRVQIISEGRRCPDRRMRVRQGAGCGNGGFTIAEISPGEPIIVVEALSPLSSSPVGGIEGAQDTDQTGQPEGLILANTVEDARSKMPDRVQGADPAYLQIDTIQLKGQRCPIEDARQGAG